MLIPDLAAQFLSDQQFQIRFIVNHKDLMRHRLSKLHCATSELTQKMPNRQSLRTGMAA
ncbi:hypothetical protein SBA3_550021 [Candidatus Sulfopaludibacter sp. SbA3]|nr:hypothetical protein SBA3_550021 [Candidatus Sulfopaludibacter sp. SbA3]